MSLRLQISLLIAFFLTVIVGGLGIAITDNARVVRDIERRELIVPLSAQLNATIRTLQIERGRTVGLISSGGASANRQALDDHRPVTDQAMSAMLRVIGEQQIGANLAEVKDAVDALRALPGKVRAHRAKVDAGEISVPQNVAFYTGEIDAMIELIYGAISVASDTETAMKMTSFAFLVQAMEHGGLERALGAALFNQAAAGDVKSNTYKAYASRKAREQNALGQFLAQADTKIRDRFDATVSGPHIAQIDEWRQILAVISETNQGQGVSGKVWFDTATVRLNQIYDVSETLLADADAYLTGLMAQTRSAQHTTMVAAGLIVLLSLLVAVFMLRSIRRDVALVQNALQRLRMGDVTLDLPQKKPSGEIGQILSDVDGVAEYLGGIASVADRLSSGDLKNDVAPASIFDRLTHAFQIMAVSLNDVLTGARKGAGNYPPPGGVVSGRDGTLNGLKGSCACKASGIHNGA